MRRLAAAAMVAICGLLAACTQPVPTAAPLSAGYLMAGRSCGGGATLPATALTIGTRQVIHLAESSPCITAGSGVNEPAVLLSLPVSSDTYYVTVRVWRGAKIVVPRIELLDGNRRPVQTLTYRDMRYAGGALTATIFVEPGRTAPAFLLLYPDPALVGKSVERIQQGASMASYGFFYVSYGTAGKSPVTFAESGTLEVDSAYDVRRSVPAGG
ncbi:MAG TPA: hypothetical protein VFX38_07590 [Gammaproteobacteria bacterium]|nr:hypothetical protein [Gammaproteobacteria bacterium]